VVYADARHGSIPLVVVCYRGDLCQRPSPRTGGRLSAGLSGKRLHGVVAVPCLFDKFLCRFDKLLQRSTLSKCLCVISVLVGHGKYMRVRAV